MRVLLLGATGAIGRKTAAELARSEEVTELVVGGRDEARTRRLASFLGGERRRVSPLVVDASDEGALRAAMEGRDVVASCLGPTYLFEQAAARAAIAAGVPYISLCDDHEVVEEVFGLGSDAAAAGITVVSGCGVSPGITGLLVALAESELDRVVEIELSLAGSSADTPGPATATHFLAMLAQDAPFISDHRPSAVRAGTVAKPVYFPEPVGWVETFRCGHPEVLTFTRRWPDLRSLQFRIGLTERALMDVSRLIAFSGKLTNEQQIERAERMTRPIRPLLEHLPPIGAPWTALRCDVRGTARDKPRTITYGVVDHLANLAPVPLSLGIIELGTKRAERHGVWTSAEVFDARSFLRAITRRGIRIAALEPYPV